MGNRVLKRDGYVKRGVKCAPEQVKQGAGARETSCLCGKTPFGGTPILSRTVSCSRTPSPVWCRNQGRGHLSKAQPARHIVCFLKTMLLPRITLQKRTPHTIYLRNCHPANILKSFSMFRLMCASYLAIVSSFGELLAPCLAHRSPQGKGGTPHKGSNKTKNQRTKSSSLSATDGPHEVRDRLIGEFHLRRPARLCPSRTRAGQGARPGIRFLPEQTPQIPHIPNEFNGCALKTRGIVPLFGTGSNKVFYASY